MNHPSPQSSPSAQSLPLWRLLQATALVVQAVKEGRSLTTQIDSVATELRPGVQALSFQVMRQWGRALALRGKLASKAPPPAADALLCTALALCWRDSDAPYPVHTLVNQTVEAAQKQRHTKAQSGFINACLRRFMRERAALIEQTDGFLEARWNHPGWWIERLQKDYPEHWQSLLDAAQRPAPMTLRVNVKHQSVQNYQRQLNDVGIMSKPVGVQGLQLEKPVPVQRLPGFSLGHVSVQDAAAQLAAPLLTHGMDRQYPWRILDACAAPGGKTGHLLELLENAQVWALDVDSHRAERIEQNLTRTGVHAKVITGDAMRTADWWDGVPFDAILLDAPCTASGVVRRHPDVRWLRRATDSAQLAGIQRQILQALWPLLTPGGKLLYCTCSIFKAEGDGGIQAFLQHNTDAQLHPSPGHLIPGQVPEGLPFKHNALGEHDGFYYALLEKRRV
ncbi:MAG: 16S rRNA (cytosine(967)-C(5))-methyltransferase [Comamonadaceae bacterium PBBC1]|nr:MAG: 16S rRNA (cytosine(967)-C(5))-methyltransferase [Comamonadaceae bacterium PBBC1]